MTRTPLRLTLPATPRSSREQLRAVLPRPLWSSLPETQKGTDPARPLLLGCHGTGFMDDCFRWLSGQAPLPPQRAWHDWCEPPAAMLTPAGTAAYPATIERGIPWGLEPETETETSGLDSDGVPKGSPAWLRKLYLPQHDRFTVVVLELICLAAGWPPLDRRRIKEAGLLVRRLRPGDPSAVDEQWEDWIATDQRLGSWQLPQKSWEDDPERDPASRPGLASQPLVVAPSTLEGMGRRCVLTGYLSLTPVEQEVSASPPPADPRGMAAEALKGRTAERLQAPGAAAATTELLPPAIPLRELLEYTLLPTAPAAGAVAGARTALVTLLSGDQLDQVLEQALLVLIGRALDSRRFAADVNRDVICGGALWGEGSHSVVAEGLLALRHASPGAGVPADGDDHWDVLVCDRLQQLLEAWISGKPLPALAEQRRARFRDALLPALVAASLVRARGFRLALAAAIHGAQGEPVDDLISTQTGRARHSLADLGEGLEGFLATERERGPANAPRLERVDRNLRTLAEHYAPFGAALAGASAEVRFELQERAQDLENRMGEALNELRQLSGQASVNPGIPSLLERGLDLLEPPATGLLLLPGLGEGLADRLNGFTAAVPYRSKLGTSQLVAEALVELQLQRPRFDVHHIYAVQAWVRVSGRAPGEAERLIWSPRSEPFVLAGHTDQLGSQPMAVPLRNAGANPFLRPVPPRRSAAESTGGGLEGLRRDWGMGTALSLVAVVGLGMLSSALRTFSRLAGFAWMHQVVICTPAPELRP
jgi:hypothetical protein